MNDSKDTSVRDGKDRRNVSHSPIAVTTLPTTPTVTRESRAERR